MENMLLGYVDLAIIGLYLCGLVFIGLYLKKQASKSLDSYLLGGNKIPWYMLGLSNASGMFDISGTVWLVAITVVYGIKSIWIPWLWPVFNQIFLMIYLSSWLRRSDCITGAQWVNFRFGKDKGAALSHTIIVIFAIIVCLGMLAYGFIGMGKFIEIFLPLKVVFPFMSGISDAYVPHVWGILFTAFAVFYSLLGGMLSIVWADVAQYMIMTMAAIAIAFIAMLHLGDLDLTTIVPAGWHSPFFGAELGLNWSDKFSTFNQKITDDGYSIFSLFFGMVLVKGILNSIAGPSPSYDMQKVLSARNSREASLMSGFVSVILMPVRYLMIAGIAILGLLLFDQLKEQITVNNQIDFELVLPAVIKHEWIPSGLTGLLLAGLLAAFMSTFAGTLNASQAYIVNDIYIKYFRPNATAKQTNMANYVVGLVVVAVSILFGMLAQDVNSVLMWITSALYGGYIAPNILKWHWWRFNSRGYAWGMIGGMIPALILPFVFPNDATMFGSSVALYYFPIILLVSFIACLLGTYTTEPTEAEALKNFYRKTRPWGLWDPVYKQVIAETPSFQRNMNFKRDVSNIAVGIVWQTCLVASPIYFVLKEYFYMAIGVLIIGITTFILKKNWYDKLESEEVADAEGSYASDRAEESSVKAEMVG